MNHFILVLVFIVVFVWYLYTKNMETFMENEPVIVRLKNKLNPYFPELQRVKIMKDNASYTINKSKIYICTESEGKVYDDNMLTYVILHELAHTMAKSIGHNEEFKTIFTSLLERAERAQLYNPSLPRPENYCTVKK